MRRRRDLPFPWGVWLFGAFIIGCGVTHLMEVVTIFAPMYRLAGVIKLLTAAVSVATAISLIPLLPKVLALRTPTELETEIARRLKMEEVLRQSEERFRALTQSANDAIVTADASGMIVYWNKAAQSIFGYSEEEALGKPISMLQPVNSLDAHQKRVARFIAIGAARRLNGTIELQGLRKNGSEFPVEMSLATWTAGNKPFLSGILRDITQRKATESLLRRNEERFRLLVDGVKDYGIFLLDPGGRVATWNAGAQRIKGYAPEEIIGQHFSRFYTDADLQADKPARELETAAAVGRCEDEGWRVRKDGSRFWANVVITALRDNDGTFKGFSKLTRDLSERKQAAEALEFRTLQLQRSNRELEQFASVASHDLQEPLRKIQAFGDRLQAKCGPVLGEEGRQFLDRMLGAAGRMRTLINDLLSFALVATKARPFVAVDLRALAGEVVADLEGLLQSTGGSIDIGDLPIIDGDPAQLRQLLLNLIGNALKYRRPEEYPVVRVSGNLVAGPIVGHSIVGHAIVGHAIVGHAGADPVPTLCVLTVADNGIGFDEVYLDRIFDVFQRLHSRQEFEGTGMGLAICRKIVEQHRGAITARSQPGQGAIFIVTLPTKQSEESPQHEKTAESYHHLDGRR